MRLIRQASPHAGLLWAAVVAVLAAATLFVFTDLRRYNLAPPPFAYDPTFNGLASGGRWEVEGDPAAVSVEGGTLRLRSSVPGTSLALRQAWPLPPGGPHAFRVAATIGTGEVAGGRAEVAFLADADIRRGQYHAYHQLAVLRGSAGPARYVARFEFPSTAREAALVIRLTNATGELTLRDLEIRALEERALVVAGRAALRAGWGLALLCGCWLFWRGVDSPRAAATLAAAASAGLVLLLMPQTGRNAVIDPLTASLPGGLLDGEVVGDLGHLAIFAAAGLLVRLSRRREPAARQLPLLIVLAGVAELLQFLTELREPDWGDWAVNVLGALAGWLPAVLWVRLQEGQFATQRGVATTLPPQAAKQRR